MKRKADCDAKEEVEAHRMKIMRSTMALVRNDADDTKKQASLKAKKELLVSLTEEFNEQVLGEIHEKMSELPESIKKEVKEKVQSISLGPVEWFSDKLEGYLNEINAQINWDRLASFLSNVPTSWEIKLKSSEIFLAIFLLQKLGTFRLGNFRLGLTFII